MPGHPITDDELADLEPHRGENDEYAALGANIFTHLGVGAIAVWRSVAARLFRVRENGTRLELRSADQQQDAVLGAQRISIGYRETTVIHIRVV